MASISIETKKIVELEAASAISDDDLLIVRTGSGSKKITVGELFSRSNTGMYLTGIHNNGEGRNLGTQFTTEQAEMIAAGDFKSLWNGDYWVDGARKWRITDNTDYYWNKGDTPFDKHGLVIMPDDNILKADGSTTKYMMDTNETTQGYQGTKYRNTYRNQAKRAFTDFFGAAHIATYRDLQSNASANGHASNWSWVDADVELPGEVQIYGSKIWSPDGTAGYNGYDTGIGYPQFALFRLAPKYATNRENYWLRDVVSAASFALVADDGFASTANASYPYVGCRPFALLI